MLVLVLEVEAALVTVILPQFAVCFKLLFRHTTEVIKNTLDPVWRPFSLKSSQLAASPETNFRINVIDWDAVGAHDPIGHIILTPKVLSFHAHWFLFQVFHVHSSPSLQL